MKLLRGIFDRVAPHFHKGGKYERFYPVYEVVESFVYTSDEVTTGTCHVRDAIDLKRTMSVVLVALLPCVVMGMYNTGYQANFELKRQEITEHADLLAEVTGWLGSALETVEKNSLDYYSALRSYYRQNRRNEILDGKVKNLPLPGDDE